MTGWAYFRENWPWLAYGTWITDALRATPDRDFTVIQSCHMADFDAFFSSWRDFPEGLLEAIPKGKITWLTLRNDDLYSFQHGDYDIVGEFIRNLPPESILNRFLRRGPDFAWLPEACMSKPDNIDGFITIPLMLDNIPYPDIDNRNVLEYSRKLLDSLAGEVGEPIKEVERDVELVRNFDPETWVKPLRRFNVIPAGRAK